MLRDAVTGSTQAPFQVSQTLCLLETAFAFSSMDVSGMVVPNALMESVDHSPTDATGFKRFGGINGGIDRTFAFSRRQGGE